MFQELSAAGVDFVSLGLVLRWEGGSGRWGGRCPVLPFDMKPASPFEKGL